MAKKKIAKKRIAKRRVGRPPGSGQGRVFVTRSVAMPQEYWDKLEAFMGKDHFARSMGKALMRKLGWDGKGYR